MILRCIALPRGGEKTPRRKRAVVRRPQPDKFLVAAALVGVEPQGEKAEGMLGGLGMLGRRLMPQPLDGMPVLRHFGPLLASLPFRGGFLLPAFPRGLGFGRPL